MMADNGDPTMTDGERPTEGNGHLDAHAILAKVAWLSLIHI